MQLTRHNPASVTLEVPNRNEISGIYQIKNELDGKRYIGSSVNIRARWRRHKSMLRRGVHHSPYLQNAWNKYGKTNFSFKVLLLCPPNDLLKYEQAYLDTGTCDYNTAICAEAPTRGIKLKESTKRKMSKARMGNQNGKGYKHTKEAREKISAALKKRVGENHPLYGVTGEDHPLYGHKFTDEQKRHLSESHMGQIPWNKGEKMSKEYCRKNSEAHIGITPSEETKRKMSESQKLRWANKKARKNELNKA